MNLNRPLNISLCDEAALVPVEVVEIPHGVSNLSHVDHAVRHEHEA